MTIFKGFLKILKKNIVVVIMYSVILLVFGISNMQTSDNNMSFVSDRPDVYIVSKDNGALSKNLVSYIKDNSNIIKISNEEDKINDALFYRDVCYVIYIPNNYSKDFLDKKNPTIEIKSTGDYEASLEEMILKRYLKVADTYLNITNNEDELIKKINETLKGKADVEITSKVEVDSLSKASYYYNFASYSILACLIFIIGLVLCSFNNQLVKKRIIISSIDYKKHNRLLLFSNLFYSVVLWLVYVLISFIIVGDVMLSAYGLIYIINSLVLTFTATTLAFLIGTLINDKNAMNGVVNIVALGSSFLCGAFVPVELLPDAVLKIAHIIPTYYYINTNNLISSLEKISIRSLEPIINNMITMIIFSVIFIIITNCISKYKRKIG